MNITKIGHSCLLIKEKGLRILIDPGVYSVVPNDTKTDIILITHEHPDHFDIEALAAIRAKNPDCEIITHKSLVEILASHEIPATLITDGEEIVRNGVTIMRVGNEHACIHQDLPKLENCGFLIAGKLFYPGDSFVLPNRAVEVLALPVAAPWMRLEECIEYAKSVKPEVVFPVHDGMLRSDRMTPTRRIPAMLLEKANIRFVDMLDGWNADF